MTRARRQDANHAEIREAFRALGIHWADTHQVGNGFPDGVASYAGVCLLVEIKDASKPPSARKLTDKERDFHDRFRSARVVESIEDVRITAQTLRTWHRYICEGIARDNHG